MYPVLLAFFPFCSGYKYITDFYVIAFYTHIAQMQITNARCKAARIRPTIHRDSHDRQELMKSGFYHISLIHFAQGIPFKCCWWERDLSYSQRQHLSLSASESQMTSKESREEHRQII